MRDAGQGGIARHTATACRRARGFPEGPRLANSRRSCLYERHTPIVDDDLQALEALLPSPDDVWLCVVYGSAARGALVPTSDIDVLGEGHADALDAWREAAERVIDREVNLSGVEHMLRQPMMVAEVLDGPIVLRDSRDRLGDMRRAAAEDGSLRSAQICMLGDALREYPQERPARSFTGGEQRFMEALARLRRELEHFQSEKALERQWAVGRMTRLIRNMLRDWPIHGDYVQPRRAIENLTGTLDAATINALRELPYEQAASNPVAPQLDPGWTQAQELLAPVLDALIAAAAAALRASIHREG